MLRIGWRGPLVVRATRRYGNRGPLPSGWRLGPFPVAMLTAVLFLGTACGRTERAGEPGPAGATLLPARGPVCGPEPEPAHLPAVDAVVDSARLADAVADLGGGDPARAGHVVLSLEFDEVGVMMHRDILEHSTSRAVADSVWRLVRAVGRDAGEAATQWGVRLRVDVAAPVELTVARREFCRPVPRNPRLQEAMQTYSRPGVRVRRGERVETVHMRVRISDLGTVTAAAIVRGRLTGGALEHELFRFLQQFLFYPATIDGAPTDAWVEIPVHVRIPA